MKELGCAAMVRLLIAGLGLGSFAAQVQVNGRTFTVPDGFTVELVAGPPLVDRPIIADFDEQHGPFRVEAGVPGGGVPEECTFRLKRAGRSASAAADGTGSGRRIRP